MAKKEDLAKIILERDYTIPLGHETLKVPPFRKANKAIKAVRQFIGRHMKSNDISLGHYLNLQIWRHGAKNPPHYVKVSAIKDEKGRVIVELAGAPKKEPKMDMEKKTKDVAKEEPDKEASKEPAKEMTAEEKLEKEVEEIKVAKAQEAIKIEKEEIKELKKEHPPIHTPKMVRKEKVHDEHPVAPKKL